MERPTKFIFDRYSFDHTSGCIELTYRLGDMELTERLTVPTKGWQAELPQADLDRALFALHLIAGVSYWKTYCPRKIEVHTGSLSAEDAEFWNTLYTKGLGEFFYKNQIDFRGRVKFPTTERAMTPHRLTAYPPNRLFPLVPIGGGKDSIVTIEMLKQAGCPVTLFTIKDAEPIRQTAEISGLPRLVITRELDTKLLELNTQGAYNGHVPISAYNAFVSVFVGLLFGHTDVVFSFEKSASTGNLTYLDTEINHQYSKALEFERAVQAYLSRSVTRAIRVFSLLRPLTEFAITKRFVELPQYHRAFSSCNRNFRIGDPQTKVFWCGSCPKCAFVFVLLAAHRNVAYATEILGKNLLADLELVETYRDLLGIGSQKPFECVGEPDEVQTAFAMIRDCGEATETPAMQLFTSAFPNLVPDLPRLLFASPDHAIPVEYQFVGKNIVLVGFERTNAALYRSIRRWFPSLPLTIADQSPNAAVPNDPQLTVRLGDNYLNDLDAFDLVIRSPGVRYWPELQAVRNRVTTATRLFFRFVREQSSAKIVGITGTKGKSTTCSLLHACLLAAGKKSVLIGNIGAPDWDAANELTDDTIIVYELSSYMLEDLQDRPDIAVMLDLFPDHMDWHGSFEAYAHAKANITRWQTPEDLFIYNARFAELGTIAKQTRAKTIGYPNEQTNNFPRELLRLPGTHNAENLQAVLAVCHALGISFETIKPAIATFAGLPHRLQNVGTYGGITFIDDAISTTPESTLAGVEAVAERLGSIILGGLDRGYDFTELTQRISELHVPAVILLPGARDKLKTALSRAAYAGVQADADTMEAAVAACYRHTPPGRVALLSTAAPSYDLFKNYEDQGDQFAHCAKTQAPS